MREQGCVAWDMARGAISGAVVAVLVFLLLLWFSTFVPGVLNLTLLFLAPPRSLFRQLAEQGIVDHSNMFLAFGFGVAWVALLGGIPGMLFGFRRHRSE